MTRLIQKKKARKGYDAKNPVVRSAVSVRRARSNRRKGVWPFIRRNYKLLSIAAAVAVAGVVCLFVFLGGTDQAVSGQPAETVTSELPVEPPTDTLPVSDEVYDYSTLDPDVLAGLAGTDDGLFTDDEYMADALFAEEGLRIGVTIGKINSEQEELILNRLEQASNAAEKDKLVYQVYYYNANGDYNQQVQDVRSLIKNKVDAIIVGFSDVTSFNMVSMMAKEEGIPVIAFDAPVESGYAVNVVADNKAWGDVYGDFMARNLPDGKVVGIMGSENDASDNARKSAIYNALKENDDISVAVTAYASWKKADAKAAMAAYLADGEAVDGVITEEGMAEGVLDAFLEAGTLPQVMCGDATAGFIKKWYALKNSGLNVTSVANKQNSTEPTPAPVLMIAQPGEMIVCAQPAPTALGAVAFEIAVRLAEGRRLKNEGLTYAYRVGTLITDDNLKTYYDQIKDEHDTYVITDLFVTADIDMLFEPSAGQTE